MGTNHGDTHPSYKGYSRNTRVMLAIFVVPFIFILATLSSWPWYLEGFFLLVGMQFIALPFDQRVAVRTSILRFNFHHFFELPALLLFGIYLGHDLSWFEAGILIFSVWGVMLAFWMTYRRYRGWERNVRGNLKTLLFFLIPVFLGSQQV